MRDGDYYAINGQKVYTSGAHQADYVWLACRTDPDSPKHHGISIIIVPLNAEGVEIHPFNMMTGGRTNITYYNDVRVPVSARVGEENRGWYYMTTQLDFERVGLSPVPQIERIFGRLCELFQKKGVGVDEEWTRVMLASMAADLQVLKVMDMKAAWTVASGEVPVAEASMIKVLSNELNLKLLGDTLQALGDVSLIREGFPDAVTDSRNSSFESQRRGAVINLFGGGNNDIQRDIMATHGLGLPR